MQFNQQKTAILTTIVSLEIVKKVERLDYAEY